MKFRLLALSSVLVLTSCAYALDSELQDVRIETPGAENAVCYMYVEKLRYKVRPPQTVNISNSRKDMMVDCLAPGNRRKKVYVQARMQKKAIAEAPLVAPFLWDVASAAAWKYPDVITVDFTYAQVTPEPLPAQNRPDVKQPEEYLLEEFMPGRPRLNSDRYATPVELRRRETPGPISGEQSPYMIEESTTTGKGDLQPAKMPSAVAPANTAPTSLMTGPDEESSGPSYPGQ